MNDFVLYNYYRSSASYRVRIALYLKNIAFEYRPVHLLNNGGEQNSAEYRQINPAGEVPTLVHKDKKLSQSLAILMYLDQIQPQPQLFPQDAFAKAKVWQICEHINASIQPLQNLKVLQILEKKFSASNEQKNQWAEYWISSGLDALEKLITETGGNFCFGNDLTAADVVLIPQLFTARRFNVDIGKYKIISQIEKNCLDLPAFKRAHPNNQPDTPTN